MKQKTSVVVLMSVIATACTIGGAVVSTTFSPRWPATVLIQIGQIGRESPLADPGSVVQRVNFKGFASQTLTAVGLPEDPSMNRTSQLVDKTLKGTIPKGGQQYIELTVEAYSRDEARKVIEAALGILQSEHAAVLQPGKERLERSLEDIKASADSLSKDRIAMLQRVQSNGSGADRKFSENVLLSGLIRSNDSELRALRDQRLNLEERLDPSRTFNTRAVAPVYQPERPSKTSKVLAALVGLFGGLLIDAVLLLWIDPEFRKKVFTRFGRVPEH